MDESEAILLTLPKKLVEKIDKEVGVFYRSRQQVIEDAIRQFFKRKDLVNLTRDYSE